jgi:SOS response regulatory protein OraA/RecX
LKDKPPVEVRASDLRRAAMDLLARREHSSQEMITKLKRRFRQRLEGDDLCHTVVDELMA